MIETLTGTQRRVFEALMDLEMTDGTPTVREVRASLGQSSTNAVAEVFTRLKVRGLITTGSKSRSTEVTARGWECWAEVLSERLGETITPVEARLYTRLWRDVRDLGAAESVDALRKLIARLGGVSGHEATATP